MIWKYFERFDLLYLVIGLFLFAAYNKDDDNMAPEAAGRVQKVITLPVSNIRAAVAISENEIVLNASLLITRHGVYWRSINDLITAYGRGAGAFDSQIRRLTESTTYFLRTYMTTNVNRYGSSLALTTTPALCDIEGNGFTYVTTGNQNWMADNLHTITLNDGAPITDLISNIDRTGTSMPVYSLPDNDENMNGATFDAFHNGNNVITEKVYSLGRRTPGRAEWTDHIQYVRGSTKAGDRFKAANCGRRRMELMLNELDVYLWYKGR